MAIKPIDVRLNELNQETAQLNQAVDLASEADLALPSDVPADLPVTEEVDGVQVAGIGKSVKQIVEAVSKVELRKPPAPVSKAAEDAANLQDLQKASEFTGVGTQMEAGIAGTVEQRKIPTLTPDTLVQQKAATTAEDLAGKPTKVPFNMPLIETTDDVKKTIDSINKLAGIETKKITFEQVKEAAQNAGIGPKFIDDLFKGKLAVDPENTYKAMNAMVASAQKLDDLAQVVARGNATPEQLAEMAQTVNFHSVLQQSVKGYQTNVAQSLAVMRIPRTGAANIDEIMESFGTTNDMTKFAQAYLDLKDPMARAKMIAGAAQGNTWEKLFTVYVNGLLSRPTTHIKNILSNTIFLPYRLAERGTAAGIGKIRRAVGLGAEDSYRFTEVPTILASTSTAMRNGWQLAAHAWKEGVPKGWVDPVKIARQQARMDLFNYKADGSILSAGVKALNFAVTLPGRSLMTADEFFKGINYTNELAAEATRLQIKTFEDAIAGGAKTADAEAAATNAVNEFLLDPPDHIAAIAETGTFTQKLEGAAAKLQNAITPNTATGFVLRTQMPFIATPVNIMGEVIQRTPLAAFSPTVWKAIKAGGKEADMAVAKVGLGGAALYQFSDMAMNGTITGSGPGDRGTRDAMIRQGWQPYSMVFDFEDIDEDFRQAMSQLPMSVRFGSGDYSGKVFVSYQGMEPVGALMAMSADYVDYSKYEGDDSRLNATAGGLAFGFANYMMESPFLQGVSNIQQLMGGYNPNDKAGFVTTINNISQTMGQVAYKSVIPLSGAIASVKEKIDPTMRDYKADPNLPAGLQGMMTAFNKMRSELPGLSEDLPPKLNIWGEPSDYEYVWAPWRMKEGKMRPVDQALIQLNANVSMPTRTLSAQDENTGINTSIKLTTEEYNRMLQIANEDFQLEDRVMTVIDALKDDSGRNSLITYQNSVRKVFEDTFKQARDRLFMDSEYSYDLQDRLSQKAQQLQEFGRGAK